MRAALVAVAVLGLAACQPAPAMTTLGGVDLGKPVRALGTEPFWGVEVSLDAIVFTGVDRADFQAEGPVLRMAGAGAVFSAKDAAGAEIILTLKPDKCSDGMSDFVYPLSAEVKVGGETLVGCAASQTVMGERPRA